MKFKLENTELKFRPIEINITCETYKELQTLYCKILALSISNTDYDCKPWADLCIAIEKYL